MTFPPGTHAMWMRYYLGAGGINPDKDIALITVPPPQMVANMKIGKMDGFCVGEPWNARSIADKHRLHFGHHAGYLEGSSGKGLRVHRRIRRQEPENRQGRAQGPSRRQRLARRSGQPPGAGEIVSEPTYINCRQEIILGRLHGNYDYGDGREDEGSEPRCISARRNCNYPQSELCQMVAHPVPPLGHGQPAHRITKGSQRSYARGYLPGSDERNWLHARRPGQRSKETLFDGVDFCSRRAISKPTPKISRSLTLKG